MGHQNVACMVSPPVTWHWPLPPPDMPSAWLVRSKRQRMVFFRSPYSVATTLPLYASTNEA